MAMGTRIELETPAPGLTQRIERHLISRARVLSDVPAIWPDSGCGSNGHDVPALLLRHARFVSGARTWVASREASTSVTARVKLPARPRWHQPPSGLR